MSSNKQIFQADNPGRWNRFKWLSRLILVILIVGAVAAVITVTSTEYPILPNLDPAPKKISKKELEELKKSKKYKDFKIEKAEIEVLAKARRLHQLKHPNNDNRINAGFYKAWEPQAYYSLKDFIAPPGYGSDRGLFLFAQCRYN
jgi:uncharacterized membrane protein